MFVAVVAIILIWTVSLKKSFAILFFWLKAQFLEKLSDFIFCGSPWGLCMSLVLFSKPVVSCIEVEAMLLSVLKHFIGAFLCHGRSCL